MSSTRPDLKFSDNADERSFYTKFSKLPTKDNSTIRIVDNNKDYFTALDDDADLIADNIYKTQSVIKYSQSRKNKYVTIASQVFLNNVLKFVLIDKHLKLEIYNKSFELICTATAGNLVNLSNEYGVNLESMFQDCSNPIIAAIRYTSVGNSMKKVGVALIDTSNSTIQLSEFEDNDLFSNLESLLLQLGVKEVVLPSNYSPEQENSDTIKLFQVIDKIGNLVISSTKSSVFNTKDIEQDLSKIVINDNVDKKDEEIKIELILASKGINSIDFQISLSCCNALIVYLDLLGDNEYNFTIDQYNLTSFMKLDSSTMKALNIFPISSSSSSTTSASPNSKSSTIGSIFELLNKCKTVAGSRLLSQWLKQPLTNLSMIEERQDLVSYLISNTNLRVFLSQEFASQVPDIKRLLKKISVGVGKSVGNENKKLEDVVRLYQLILVLPTLIETLKTEAEGNSLVEKYWLQPIQRDYELLLKFQELIETTIDLSPLEASSSFDLLNTDFNIKPEFDDSLVEIDNKLQSALEEIKQQHIEVGDDLNMELDKKLKLEKHIQHGWCFRVTRIDSTVLRNTNNRYNELQVVKAGVYFTTKKLAALSKQYSDASTEYNRKQRELIKEILAITLTYQQVFTSLTLSISHLDVLTSFANVAITAPITFIKPKLHPLSGSIDSPEFKNRKIQLRDARHPVVEVQDDVSFIANDVKFSNEDKSFAIITGPNMGGKSTYIRQVGVIALMSQIGSFIPVSDDEEPAEIPIFDAILSRVGAGDSQLKGLSTFMIEMLETSSILATATHNSLIIIDELGRGTSTYDGFGLAWSISEHLITNKNCFTLFATHFHELTQLASKYSNVDNLHVVAHVEKDSENDDDITLMYKVEPGISDKSFGIHVAELVKFPTKIINMAKRKASELQDTNLSENDKFIQNKRTKCNEQEINDGLKKLKDVLKQWKNSCYNEADGTNKFTSDEAIEKLRILVDEQGLQNNKLVSEILNL
ncbi:muts domain V-domain-containing protein [Scheffersomyces amazonensis]|uniref:muts domain V-domain-containing protein n=1 Tax=Scheffersomyces amazonensis TaxID=1078765 RepID=UPI00315D4BC4